MWFYTSSPVSLITKVPLKSQFRMSAVKFIKCLPMFLYRMAFNTDIYRRFLAVKVFRLLILI